MKTYLYPFVLIILAADGRRFMGEVYETRAAGEAHITKLETMRNPARVSGYEVRELIRPMTIWQFIGSELKRPELYLK